MELIDLSYKENFNNAVGEFFSSLHRPMIWPGLDMVFLLIPTSVRIKEK